LRFVRIVQYFAGDFLAATARQPQTALEEQWIVVVVTTEDAKITERPGAATKASYRSNTIGSLPVGRRLLARKIDSHAFVERRTT
jgi:hypothetical protein